MATVTAPDGTVRRVSGFEEEPGEWVVRYASPLTGRHEVATDGDRGIVEVEPYRGDNPLYRHGPIRVAADGRHFEHHDGTPFFWLADTWWAVPFHREDADVDLLVRDRAAKGFTAAHLLVGTAGGMGPFDARNENQGGYPFRAGWNAVNPAFHRAAERRLELLLEAGILPVIFPTWGYYLQMAGERAMSRHLQHCLARYGSMPIAWCLAAEADMPFYPLWGTPAHAEHRAAQRAGWRRLVEWFRDADPYRRPLTLHPSPISPSLSADDVVEDRPELLDYVMLQTGHADRHSFGPSLRALSASLEREPRRPVLNGEVCYEGIMGSSWHDTQRFLFWSHLLSGAAGHSYGAAAVYGFSSGRLPQEPGGFGLWTELGWRESVDLPGSRHLGVGRGILERLGWPDLEPHPEWVEPAASPDEPALCHCAGRPRQVRVIYAPSAAFVEPQRITAEIRVLGLEAGVAYNARWVSPRTGEELWGRRVEVGADGAWATGATFFSGRPSMEDWLLVLSADR